jgi:hypothetical protein
MTTAGLNGRVRALERREPPPVPGLPEDLDAEFARWEALLAPAAALLAHDAEAVEVLYERAEDWADSLLGIPEWYRPDAWAEKAAEVRRWPGACALFFRRCPPDRAAAAAKWGLTCAPLVAERPELSLPERRRWGWLNSWLLQLTRLGSRLPPDLTPAVLGGLVGTYLDRYAELDGGQEAVCVRCGLGRPLWEAAKCNAGVCPHCGVKEFMWSGRTREFDYEWRRLAVAELDPDT